MTLIVSFINLAGAISVSDRMLTSTPGNREFDRNSNKAVIFFARDAVVSITYYDAAYIGDKPTDHWIIESLLGRSYP